MRAGVQAVQDTKLHGSDTTDSTCKQFATPLSDIQKGTNRCMGTYLWSSVLHWDLSPASSDISLDFCLQKQGLIHVQCVSITEDLKQVKMACIDWFDDPTDVHHAITVMCHVTGVCWEEGLLGHW